jgi:hypothetical protein
MNEAVIRELLVRHWQYGGRDNDKAHEIYHDDAVPELRNPANGSSGSRTS